MSTTKIKICGLFRLCDAEYVNCAMPDYAGFVFYPQSRRNISLKQALELRKALHPAIATVGVFVDASQTEIVELCCRNIINVVQLHGGESNEFISGLRCILPENKIWKTYTIRSAKDLEVAKTSAADMVLLDNGHGSGECFDWSLIRDFGRPFILAGGLTPENIPDAIKQFNPYALDISSGVESNGVKDKTKIYAAVAAARRG